MAEERVATTAPLNWNEVWFTNCPMVSANNIDQELGWCREEYKKIGVEYAYFRHSVENNWYPHYIHNLDNLIRFGGLYPPIHVHADIRRTVLLGATWVYEGGCMAVRARDPIFRMKDLKGKKIGISKSLNTIKCDWWRIQEHMGIENMLMLSDMTMDDIELVEFPYPDDWYDKPEMLTPLNNPSEVWMKRDHKHDLAFRPLETALLNGTVDAIYTQSKVLQHLQEATGKIKMIFDLSTHPDWTVNIANTPAVITCTDVMAKEHPELVVAYMKAMIRVGRWSNENKRAAAYILNRQTYYLDPEDTYQGIKHVEMVPSLAPRTWSASRSAKTSCTATATSRTTSMWTSGPRLSSWSRRRPKCSKRSGRRRAGASFPRVAGLRSKERGSARHAQPAPLERSIYRGATGTASPRNEQDNPGTLCDAHRGLWDVAGGPGSRPHPRRAHV